MSRQRLFHCLCGAITELFFAIGPSDVGVNLDGSTFNIQNFIPHKPQKPKAMAEINRPIEFQRGTVGYMRYMGPAIIYYIAKWLLPAGYFGG